MRRIICAILMLLLLAPACEAKGGFSSGGGRGGFSSGGSFRSSPSYSSRSYSSSPSRSYSSSSRSYSSGGRTVSRTTITRNYYGGGSGYYYHPYGMYGGWGMGYGYSNGLIEGMIIGNLMHPAGTTMYGGPGQYNNNAVLYPDGSVVNQQGYQVGTYVNGVFTEVQNGQMMAQPAPSNPQTAPAQPIVIQQAGMSDGEIAGIVFGCLVGLIIFFAIITA